MPKRAIGSVVQRQNGRWYVRVTRPDGRRTTRGSWANQGEAELAIPGVVEDLAQQQLEAHEALLHEFVRDTYDRLLRSRVADATVRSTLSHLNRANRWLLQRPDGLFMREVTRPIAEEFVADTLAELSPATVKRVLISLSACWRAAIDRDLADADPWTKLQLPRSPEHDVAWVSPADLARVVERVPARNRELVALLAETGLRRGEAYALCWQDVDLRRRVIHVRRSARGPSAPGGPTKGRRSREVALTPAGVAALKELRRLRARPMHGEARVFAGATVAETLRRDLHAACDAAAVPRLRVHDLRHLYASHLVRAGVPIPTVAGLLGHADGGTLVLRRYGRWQPQDAGAEAARALAAMRRGGRSARPKRAARRD